MINQVENERVYPTDSKTEGGRACPRLYASIRSSRRVEGWAPPLRRRADTKQLASCIMLHLNC